MNDYQAMEAINEVLEQFYAVEITSSEALMRIARISGANKIEHEKAGQQ